MSVPEARSNNKNHGLKISQLILCLCVGRAAIQTALPLGQSSQVLPSCPLVSQHRSTKTARLHFLLQSLTHGMVHWASGATVALLIIPESTSQHGGIRVNRTRKTSTWCRAPSGHTEWSEHLDNSSCFHGT